VRSLSLISTFRLDELLSTLFNWTDSLSSSNSTVGKPVYARLGLAVTGPALRGDEDPDKDVRRCFLSLSSDALPSPCQTKHRLFSILQILWPMAYRPSVEAGAE
jgi:hypothetical protein